MACSAFSMSDSTSPMPSMRDTIRSGWNGSRSSSRSPLPDERDRHADDGHDRQRRAAARVAVELRQHDAGHADAAVELAGALDRVLPGHRVGDVEQVGRLDRVLDRLQLVHQLVVDVQPAGGVDDDHVEAEVPSPRPARRARAATGSRSPAGSKTRSAGLRAQDAQAARSPPAAARRSRRAADGGPAATATRRASPPSSSCPIPAGRAAGRRAATARLGAGRLPRRRTARSSRRGRSGRPAGSGVRLRRTSWSIARSRTRSTNALTTLKLTSASSSASRISRSAASTWASVRRASPRSDLKTSCRRVLSDSNMRRSEWGANCAARPPPTGRPP